MKKELSKTDRFFSSRLQNKKTFRIRECCKITQRVRLESPSAVTLSTMAQRIMTLSAMILKIKTLWVMQLRHLAYSELFAITIRIFMLSIIILNMILMSVIISSINMMSITCPMCL
jgi:hypothetical protein